MSQASCTPQCAALIRAVTAGTIVVFAAPVSSLCKMVPAGDAGNLNTLQKVFCDLDEPTLESEFKEKGIKVYRLEVAAPGAIFIPQGWFIMEVAKQGPLLCGIRKSFMVGGEGPLRHFQAACNAVAASGTCMDKYHAVEAVLKAAHAAAA